MTSGNSPVFSRKIITSTGFYRCCAPRASAPVVVKNQSPTGFFLSSLISETGEQKPPVRLTFRGVREKNAGQGRRTMKGAMHHFASQRHPFPFNQGAPQGRQQKGETGPGTHIFADFCRFSLIFGSLCKSRDLGVADLRRKPQETADFRRKPQKTADFCRDRFLPICCLPFGTLAPSMQEKTPF